MGLTDREVDNILHQMHTTGKSNPTGKGSIGERAVFAICEELYQKEGGILIHSYFYNVDKDLQGNIKRNPDGSHFVENLGSSTEIDILYISKYRVFPIEVKAYKAKEILLYDDRIEGCMKTDKSPVHQNEMHCRHLYSFMFRGLPDGGTNYPIKIQGFRGFATEYIVPIVVFVDKAVIKDMRSDWQRDYMKVAILNNLKATIQQYNTPLDYQFNLTLINNLLKENMVSAEKFLPARV